MPKTFDFWERLNLSFLARCKKLIVVMSPGWEESTGLKGEIEFAEKNSIKIEYLDPAPYLKKLNGGI